MSSSIREVRSLAEGGGAAVGSREPRVGSAAAIGSREQGVGGWAAEDMAAVVPPTALAGKEAPADSILDSSRL